jgi:uncharacterized protein
VGLAHMGDQSEVIAFLMTPGSYPGEVGDVTRIDTHAASVFLAGEYAYKLKRAVKLPYLDFSTYEKRHHFCQLELNINRATAPQLYLRVVPIIRNADGRLQIGGEGEAENTAVDWLLVMKRFNNSMLFDQLAISGNLNPPLMNKLAKTISRFHANSTTFTDSDWYPSLKRIIGDIGNTLCNPDATAIGLDFNRTFEMLRTELAARKELLATRQAAGYVRRCHGDLHLNNIVLLGEEPTLFDAIEFDEELATIDVLYDLAFLIMDLWHRGMRLDANSALNSYFQRDVPAVEWEGLRLLPLFLALRAAIRAMVGMHKLLLDGKITERRAIQINIHSYARLAGEVFAAPPPQLIAIGGFSGTGKTSLARMVAPYIGAIPGAIHLRTDIERKLLHGVDPQYRLPPEAYTPESRNVVYQRTLARAESVLRTGHSVIFDAVFPDTYWPEAVRQLATRMGTGFQGIWLDAEPVQMMARVTHRTGDASDADPHVVAAQISSAPPTPPSWVRISTRGTLSDSANNLLSILRKPPVRLG